MSPGDTLHLPSIMAAMWMLLVLALSLMPYAHAAVECACDPQKPESLEARQCSLCREAEEHPTKQRIFYLKDINPRKPNRWLALPRAHGPANHHLHEMSVADRTELWTAAMEKARELWGDEWGVAYNGEKVRTQCHTHVHIGKLLHGIENDNFVVVSKPSQIPARPGEGIWIHPAGKKLHVHITEQTTETVLLR